MSPPTAMYLSLGAARSSIDRKEWKEIKVGDIIKSGSYIQVSDSGFFIVLLGARMRPFPTTSFDSGVLYDPAVYPANLLGLNRNAVVKVISTRSKRSAESGEPNEHVLVSLFRGSIQGYVKSQIPDSTYEVQLTNGTFAMDRGIYRIDSTGNVEVLEGKGTIKIPNRSVTNELTAFQRFDAQTATITNLPPMPGEWHHDIWLPSDPAYFPWGVPKGPNPFPNQVFRRRF